MAVEIGWLGVLLQDPFEDQGDLVCQQQSILLIVGDHDGGDAKLTLHLEYEITHLVAQVGVQIAQRFVQQQHARFGDERPCQRYPLLLAAGKLVWTALRNIWQPDEVQHVHDLLPDDVPVHAVHFQPKAYVLLNVHVWEENVLLKDHDGATLFGRHCQHALAIEANVPRRGGEQPGNHS